MAVNTAPQQTSEHSYAFGMQAAWGTINPDATAYTPTSLGTAGSGGLLLCEPFTIERDVQELVNDSSQGSLIRKDASRIYHSKGSMPKATITSFANYDQLDHMLFAHFHNVTEGATTPFEKTFTFNTSQPIFPSNGGHFMSIVEKDPASSKSTTMKDCISQEITMSLAKGEPLKVTQNWVGRGLPSVTTDPSGTLTAPAEGDLWWEKQVSIATCDFGSGAISFFLESFECKLTYELSMIGQDSGDFKTFGLGEPAGEWTMTVMKDTDFHTAMANHASNTPVDVRVGWGNGTPGTDDNDLDFAIHGKISTIERDKAGVLTGTFGGPILGSDDGSTQPITIIMANALDRTW